MRLCRLTGGRSGIFVERDLVLRKRGIVRAGFERAIGGAGKDTAPDNQGRCPKAKKHLHDGLQRFDPAFQHVGAHLVPSAPQQAAMHIATADDAFGDRDRPLDIAAPAHETFEDDMGTEHADGDLPGVEIIGGMESALD